MTNLEQLRTLWRDLYVAEALDIGHFRVAVTSVPTENSILLKKRKRQAKRERNWLGSYASVLGWLNPRIECRIGTKRRSTTRLTGSIKAVRTSFKSPWQNGVAERWVGSCRRDLLEHVAAFNERHLQRLLSEYLRYYHEDRTHLGLHKETPGQRKTASRAERNLGARSRRF